MKIPLRVAVLVLVAMTANSAVALPPPEPLPMGTPYVYQYGNPYWYYPLYPYPSYYPFGATQPVFGRYSWDYGVYYPYPPGAVVYPIPVAVPTAVVLPAAAPAPLNRYPYWSSTDLYGRVWVWYR